MSVMVNVQPGPVTSVRFVQSPVEPPSLVVFDGTSTLVFSPAAVAGGVIDAAAFARVLAETATRWAQGCEQQVALARSADPLGVGDLFEQLGPSSGGS